VLVVSGRASFELMQKALAAGIPMLVAVGAPSSLAVQVAEKFGATLIGFTKPSGFNIYTGSERVRGGRVAADFSGDPEFAQRRAAAAGTVTETEPGGRKGTGYHAGKKVV